VGWEKKKVGGRWHNFSKVLGLPHLRTHAVFLAKTAVPAKALAFPSLGLCWPLKQKQKLVCKGSTSTWCFGCWKWTSAAAQHNLGIRYYVQEWRTVPGRMQVQAVHWYRKAAEQGFASAQCKGIAVISSAALPSRTH
jgi:hypothetical protein